MGLFTSPHLLDFRERIRVNGEMVSEDFVCRFVEEAKPLIEERSPSFFEKTPSLKKARTKIKTKTSPAVVFLIPPKTTNSAKPWI